MNTATAYIVYQNGVIADQNGKTLNNLDGFKEACLYVKSFITNVRGKTYTDDWVVVGEERIFTVNA